MIQAYKGETVVRMWLLREVTDSRCVGHHSERHIGYNGVTIPSTLQIDGSGPSCSFSDRTNVAIGTRGGSPQLGQIEASQYKRQVSRAVRDAAGKCPMKDSHAVQ